MKTICAVLNVYQDNLALPACLSAAKEWASDIYAIHSGPGGKYSTDGTIETLQAEGIRHVFADINVGFGAIRTRLIRECGCDWAFITDADEAIRKMVPLLKSEGSEKFPDNLEPNLTVTTIGEPYDQIELLQELIKRPGIDAVITRRRHWMDLTWERPAQAWDVHPDWQARIVRNSGNVGYDHNVKLHERIIRFDSGKEPFMERQGMHAKAVYHDHYHNFYKKLHPEKNAEDIATYKSLDAKGTEGMWLNHAEGVK